MTDQPVTTSADFSSPWHLADTASASAVTCLEHALMKCAEGFSRWQSSCLAALADVSATGPETALLHLIRMQETPKSMQDLLHITNREDVPNVQYALRKLAKAKLIEKRGSGRGGVTYVATPEGQAVTDRYADLRNRLLVESIASTPGMEDRLRAAAETLNALSEVYRKAEAQADYEARRTRVGI